MDSRVFNGCKATASISSIPDICSGDHFTCTVIDARHIIGDGCTAALVRRDDTGRLQNISLGWLTVSDEDSPLRTVSMDALDRIAAVLLPSASRDERRAAWQELQSIRGRA